MNIISKTAATLVFFACASANAQYANSLKGICDKYSNVGYWEVNLPIKSYTESVGEYMEMAIITFSNGSVYQVDPPKSTYISSQKPDLLRLKDTLRLAYAMGLKVKNICAWTNGSPASILGISFEE